jgi:hypothetical protein
MRKQLVFALAGMLLDHSCYILTLALLPTSGRVSVRAAAAILM